MKFLRNVGYVALVTGALSSSQAMAGENKCPTAFCEPVTIYEPGKNYSGEEGSRALRFDNPNAFEVIGKKGKVSIGNIVVTTATTSQLKRTVEIYGAVDTARLAEENTIPQELEHPSFEPVIKKNRTIRGIMEEAGLNYLSRTEGELCGESEGTFALETYSKAEGKVIKHVLYESNGWPIRKTVSRGHPETLDRLCSK